MKTLKHTFALGLLSVSLALGTSSCDKDRLNPSPKASLNSEAAFDTPSRVLLQVNNMYDYVKAGNFLGGRYQVYGDIRANDFINRTSNLVTGAAVWQHTVTEASQNDVINLWGAVYAAVNQINVFIAGVEANAGKFTAAPFPANYPATATGYVAEARFLRALCYHSLLQLYARPYIDGAGSKAGVPLRLQAELDLGNNDLARSTVAQVYDQILADLNYAELNLPLTNSASNVTRAHRNSAIALKTRVYLTMGRYGDVITEANKIVSAAAPFRAATGVAHALQPSITTVFVGNQNTTESILSFPFTVQDAPGTQNQLAYYYTPAAQGGNGEYNLNTSGVLADARFVATDERRTSLVTTVSNVPYLRKYQNGALSPAPYTDNAPVMRYSEVLLSLAEARFRTAGAADAQALALLNAVRTRSAPTAAYAAFTDVNAAVDAVLFERRVEFLGEGLRNMDLLRLNAPIPGKSSIAGVNPTDVLYIWPIPNTELATNLLMTRN